MNSFLFNIFVLNVLQVQTKQNFQKNWYIRMGRVSLALNEPNYKTNMIVAYKANATKSTMPSSQGRVLLVIKLRSSAFLLFLMLTSFCTDYITRLLSIVLQEK